MKLFKHKHKEPRYPTKSEIKMKLSLITGVPVQVANIETYICKCGEILNVRKEITGAGYQQLSWGAIEESLFDEGPIRQRENWAPPKPIQELSPVFIFPHIGGSQ
jgi:hypothetical protein